MLKPDICGIYKPVHMCGCGLEWTCPWAEYRSEPTRESLVWREGVVVVDTREREGHRADIGLPWDEGKP